MSVCFRNPRIVHHLEGFVFRMYALGCDRIRWVPSNADAYFSGWPIAFGPDGPIQNGTPSFTKDIGEDKGSDSVCAIQCVAPDL